MRGCIIRSFPPLQLAIIPNAKLACELAMGCRVIFLHATLLYMENR
jgi:hypothetical protein